MDSPTPTVQLALTADECRARAVASHGYTRERKLTPKRRAITSLELSLDERAVLDVLAEAQDLGIGEVLRRSLRLYAAHHGITGATTETEVRPAA